MEKKSEFKILCAYIVITACYLLGVDVQQIILLLTDAEQYTKDIRELVVQANGKDGTAITSGLAVAAYGAYRTYLKGKR
jgi:hypothetical protein